MKSRYIILILLISLGICVESGFSQNSHNSVIEKNYLMIKGVLRKPGNLNKIPKPMRVIALSFSSDGLRNWYTQEPRKRKELAGAMKQLTALALSRRVSPYRNVVTNKNFAAREHGLYLSHLNIILSNYRQVTGKRNYEELQERINRFLIKRTLRRKDLHIKPYPHYTTRYPADQAAVVYSIWRYDSLYKTGHGKKLVRKWVAFMKEKGTNKAFNLPVSEVTGKTWFSAYPRGCATPYLIYYMNYFAPKTAQNFWKNFKDHFMGSFLSVTLVKEWPTVNNKKYTSGLRRWKKKYGMNGDGDTGPILMEYGAAATGISLLAAKAVGDEKTYDSLQNTIQTGYSFLGYLDTNKKFHSSLNNLLTVSILFAAETR
ncbi:MAG: hypothetical protein GY754_27845 [bacterium]|nr:hypothetical protein [bacterium]